MTGDPLTRKLAVLLHADVVGSTALVQQDEALAHERIRDAFRRFDACIGDYGGITHELRGDALVAEFERASDAVAAAAAFQSLNRQVNETLGDDLRPEVRIGISLGEVVIADNTVTGAGVILAQRLEQHAEPGGIVIQASVAETVPTRMPYEYDGLGELRLKGFDRPVRAFVVGLRPGSEAPPPEGRTQRSQTPQTPQAPRAPADRPSIAVLPFANMSNDPEQEYFADGIAEDIITALSQIRHWFVIARNSSFAYKGRNVDIREIAAALGVRYILEGSVRKAGNRLRITGQLIDAESGSHLWAERFDGELEDVFALQDRVTESVVGAIEPSLRQAEIARSRRKPPADIGAYDLLLQALPELYAIRPEPNQRALELLHRAVDLDPGYAPALAYLSWGYEERYTRGWGAYGDDDAATAIELSRRAIAADRDDPHVLVLAGFALVMIGRQYDEGLEAADRARELNPNIAFVSCLVGAIYQIAGDPEKGLRCIEDAIRVSPGDPGAFIFYTAAALGNLLCGRPAEASEYARQSARIYADWDTTYRVLGAAEAELGRLDEARAAVGKLRRLAPNITLSHLRERWPIRNREKLESILDALRVAGLPE